MVRDAPHDRATSQKNRHRYDGLLAPKAPLRAAVTALARAPAATPAQPAAAQPMGGEGHYRSPARYLWAMRMARIYELFPLVRGHFGAEMRIIAFVTGYGRLGLLSGAVAVTYPCPAGPFCSRRLPSRPHYCTRP